MKKNYEALKQRQEEEKMVQNCSSKTDEESLSVNKWERESQETTRELLKVKDRLIEVERNISNNLDYFNNFTLIVSLCSI